MKISVDKKFDADNVDEALEGFLFWLNFCCHLFKELNSRVSVDDTKKKAVRNKKRR